MHFACVITYALAFFKLGYEKKLVSWVVIATILPVTNLHVRPCIQDSKVEPQLKKKKVTNLRSRLTESVRTAGPATC